jgi:hypothetical protein
VSPLNALLSLFLVLATIAKQIESQKKTQFTTLMIQQKNPIYNTHDSLEKPNLQHS